jgi:hypothetical protein
MVPLHHHDLFSRAKTVVIAEAHEALGNLHPVGHMGEISDIAQAVVYLDFAGLITPGTECYVIAPKESKSILLFLRYLRVHCWSRPAAGSGMAASELN